MTVNINSSAKIQAQLFQLFAWIQHCCNTDGVTELKLRIHNDNNSSNLSFSFNDPNMQQRFEDFLKEYDRIPAKSINPIFYLDN